MIKAFITDLKVSKAPDIKMSAAGKPYTNVLCSCYVGKDKDGNSKYLNVRVTMFGKTAERSAELNPGQLINVMANVSEVSHYMRNDDSVSCTLEITADSYEKPLSQRQSQQTAQQAPAQQQAPAYESNAQDEDLPF